MTRLLYYGFILPTSYLPYPLLYALSDTLYVILYCIIGYRRSVVKDNLTRVYGESPIVSKLERKFYKHLCDLIVEGIKGFTISDKQLMKRYKPIKMGDLESDYREGKSIILAAAHYTNWEWATMAFPLQFKHTCLGIYTPLSNAYLEDKMRKSRSRTGLQLLRKDEVKAYYAADNEVAPTAQIYLVDQSPSNPERALWLEFLGNKTPVQYGAEKYAKEQNLPVHFVSVKRVKRGYYEYEIEKITDDPSSLVYGELMRAIYERIENMISKEPGHWLWTHRRWKHVPKNS